MNDYIKLPRSILESEIAENAVALGVYLYLCANADSNGQIKFSSGDAMRQFGLTLQRYRTVINLLRTTNKITTNATNKSTNITLCDFANCNTISKSTQQIKKQPNQIATTGKKSSDTLTLGTPIKTTHFTPPTLAEVRNHILEKDYNVDAEKFIAYYESNGWMVGKNKMRNWKSALVTWNKNQYGTTKPTTQTQYDPRRGTDVGNYTETDYGGPF